MNISGDNFDELMRNLQNLLAPRPDVPYGGVLQNIKQSTEFHRQPGGRADAQTPLQSATPPAFSYGQPMMMAPWLPDADNLDERYRRVFME